MDIKPIQKIVIAGGGTAGWIAAAMLSKTFGAKLDICLVESDEIPTIGVGEATIPPLILLHRYLELDEREFLKKVKGTFKLGIQFENWGAQGDSYIHSFGSAGVKSHVCAFVNFWLAGLAQGIQAPYGDYCAEHLSAREEKFAILNNPNLNYAYHFDAGQYAALLREQSEQRGVKRIEGKITQVNQHPDSGFISSLQLASGQLIDGDFFIDCTGFQALLIGKTLNTAFKDWRHWLPCDRAIAVQTTATAAPPPYTRSIAHAVGWQWRIPLQNRVGNGYVYASDYISDADALTKLLSNIEGELLNTPRVIKFCAGTRTQHWDKNCLALGLASGFLEPLESTSIHLVQANILRFIELFPSTTDFSIEQREFNQYSAYEIERIRDFIILHYCATARDDSDFWNYCRKMDIPETLHERMELFQKSGRIYTKHGDLFSEESWVQVMLGQGVIPRVYHPYADAQTQIENLSAFLQDIRESVRRKVNQLPRHIDFINHFAKSEL